jgi:hypothetical protein
VFLRLVNFRTLFYIGDEVYCLKDYQNLQSSSLGEKTMGVKILVMQMVLLCMAAACHEGNGGESGDADGDQTTDDGLEAVEDNVADPVLGEGWMEGEVLGEAMDAEPDNADLSPDGDAAEGGDAADAVDADELEPGYGGVLCGFGVCLPEDTDNICCVIESPPAQECVGAVGDECAMYLTCDGPEDCGGSGAVCCWISFVSMTHCDPASCDPDPVLCHQDADCSPSGFCCPRSEYGYAHKICQAGPC